ncbi:MAG: aminotransferase class III-fold pyridoxal phosphate-dependent enzyme [bacterium]|nr:aminotransferase class III-fold pyridoxal phosphate-dependent enzyme [bacterium]
MHSEALNRLFYKHVGQTSSAPLALQIERAEGIYMYAKDKTYIDCISGISVSNVGHGNAKVIEAAKAQLDHYMHLMVYGEMVQEPQVNLATKLTSVLPASLNSVYYVNSGSEAIEGAMKLAKRVTGRHQFTAQYLAYHGGTHGALSLMSDAYFSRKFVPLLPGITFIHQNDLSELNTAITEETAAVFIEPIMGEKGYVCCDLAYLKAIRKRCDETGTLLVFDEIQSGYGRCGYLFALEKYGITPDILILAKGFGGGMPLGCFIADKKNMDLFQDNPVLGHITTFGGHPVSCAASLATLNFIIDNDLAEKANAKEKEFRRLLVHPNIKHVTGTGLMLAIDLEDKIYCRQVIDKCVNAGLLVDWFLYSEHKIRLAPPLIIENEAIEKICGIILENL